MNKEENKKTQNTDDKDFNYRLLMNLHFKVKDLDKVIECFEQIEKPEIIDYLIMCIVYADTPSINNEFNECHNKIIELTDNCDEYFKKMETAESIDDLYVITGDEYIVEYIKNMDANHNEE